MTLAERIARRVGRRTNTQYDEHLGEAFIRLHDLKEKARLDVNDWQSYALVYVSRCMVRDHIKNEWKTTTTDDLDARPYEICKNISRQELTGRLSGNWIQEATVTGILDGLSLEAIARQCNVGVIEIRRVLRELKEILRPSDIVPQVA